MTAISHMSSRPKLSQGTDIYRRNSLVLVAVGFASLILIVAAGAFLSSRVPAAEGLIVRTLEVQTTASDLLSRMQDAETGQRGYILTGREDYLEPYNAARAAAGPVLERLQALTADNPAQQERLAAIRPLIDMKFDELASTIELTRNGERTQALDIVNSGTGKALMDELRALLASFSQTERDLLSERQARSDRLQAVLVAIMLSAALATAATAFFVVRTTQAYVGALRGRTTELEAEMKRRAEAENTLRQAHKMEALGQLTGGIAHDFNNLLTIILGNLDTLQRRLKNADASLAATFRKSLEAAMQATRNAADLTRRLLGFARQQALSPSRVDLNGLVANTSYMLGRTVGETVTIETVLAAGLWPTFVDANQVENSLINLVVNARDAMPEGGKITIETANAYLDDAYAARFGDVNPGQYVLLSVTDTGTGISESVLNRVFEPFFTTKGPGRGSGLGLAMIHGFVKQSGGHIRIYSEIDQGTTVKVYLPRQIGADAPAVPSDISDDAAPIERAAPGETILIVEDDDGVRAYASTVLEELDYRVLTATSGPDAMLVLDSAARIDLLFTDVVLPGGMSGRQIADRAMEKRPNIPVLFTTGYTRNAIVHQGRLDPDVHLLNKPYTQRELGRKVRTLLNKRLNRSDD